MRDGAPAEPSLERYRDAVASLRLDGMHVAHLATKVETMRGGLLLRRQERVWLLVTRHDGSHDPIREDYQPWTYVLDLQGGYIDWDPPDGEVRYEVRWLKGDERREAWDRYGITKDIGAYMGGNS